MALKISDGLSDKFKNVFQMQKYVSLWCFSPRGHAPVDADPPASSIIIAIGKPSYNTRNLPLPLACCLVGIIVSMWHC